MRKNALKLLTKLVLIALLTLPFAAFAEARGGHFHGGYRGVIIPRYSYIYPYDGWGWGWGWGWGPYWDYGPYYYHETMGKIKIKDHNKYDKVYINGAYSGRVEKMKDIKLDPGRYTVEIQRDGKQIMNQSVYIVAGKTVEIDVNGG
jgi:hypothetical protein